MKSTQGWTWLAAGILALGLNGFYHDGGLDLAHRVAGRIADRSVAALDTASYRAESLLARTELVPAAGQASSCRVAAAFAHVQARAARTQANFDRFQAMSDHEQARFEANRARMEAQVARVRFATISAPMVCPRVHVAVSSPHSNISVPSIQVSTGTGPI